MNTVGGMHGMITRAQSKQYAPQRPYHIKPKLTAMEKCLLRWTMAERGDKVLDAHERFSD